MKKIILLAVIVVLFSAVRFFIPFHTPSFGGSYQAFAHLFVGGLIGAWLVSREKLYGFLALVLTGVELIAFFTLR